MPSPHFLQGPQVYQHMSCVRQVVPENTSISGRQISIGMEVAITSMHGNFTSWHSAVWRMSGHGVTLTKVTLIFPRVQSLCKKAKVKRWHSRSSQVVQGFSRLWRSGPQLCGRWSWKGVSHVSLRFSLLLTLLKHFLPQAKWFMALGSLLLQDIYVSWQMVYCTTCSLF